MNSDYCYINKIGKRFNLKLRRYIIVALLIAVRTLLRHIFKT